MSVVFGTHKLRIADYNRYADILPIGYIAYQPYGYADIELVDYIDYSLSAI